MGRGASLERSGDLRGSVGFWLNTVTIKGTHALVRSRIGMYGHAKGVPLRRFDVAILDEMLVDKDQHIPPLFAQRLLLG